MPDIEEARSVPVGNRVSSDHGGRHSATWYITLMRQGSSNVPWPWGPTRDMGGRHARKWRGTRGLEGACARIDP